ncbi:cytochrome P450 [Geopyxis carbonaria]|nr:cytochrome P450 [Geopyxis carbonaria]
MVLNLCITLCWAFVLFIASIVVYRRATSNLRHLPGPLVSYVPYYNAALSLLGIRTITIYKLHEQYGSIVRISPKTVSILSSKSIRAVYSSPAYTKYVPVYSQFRHYNSDNSFTAETRLEHGWRRRGIAGMYSEQFVQNCELQHGRIRRICGDYIKIIERAVENGVGVDIYTINTFYAADCISAHLFGEAGLRCLEGNTRDQEIAMGHHTFSKTNVWIRADVPWFRKAEGLFDSAMSMFTTKVKGPALIREWIVEAWEKSSHEADTVSHQVTALGWSPNDICSELMDQFLAGIDTTSDILTYCLYELSLFESCVVQKELQEVLPQLPKGTTPLEISHMKALLPLPYINAVLYEIIRLHPAQTDPLPRVAPFDTALDGFFIPEGTVVGSFSYGIHRDHQIFGPKNVDKFLPRRWLNNKNNLREKEQYKQMTGRFWGFGSGTRIQAIIEMKILLATVYNNYSTMVEVDEQTECGCEKLQWKQRKTFRDVLPYTTGSASGPNGGGIVRFVPRMPTMAE